jgi:hypothetical protein
MELNKKNFNVAKIFGGCGGPPLATAMTSFVAPATIVNVPLV